MEVKQKIQEDMKEALKAGDKEKVSALRMLLAEIKNAEIRKMGTLSEDEVYQVVAKQVKKWEEAAEEYRKAGDEERASKETKDAEILRAYLPEQLTEDELKELIKKKIKETSSSSLKDMGKVMQAIMPEVKGRADGSKVSLMVREELSRLEQTLS